MAKRVVLKVVGRRQLVRVLDPEHGNHTVWEDVPERDRTDPALRLLGASTPKVTGWYGAQNRRRRRQWAERIRRGEEVICCRCLEPLDDEPWDLDHSDMTPQLEAPAHRSCNRGAHRLRTSREW